jgi:hypothetical protein
LGVVAFPVVASAVIPTCNGVGATIVGQPGQKTVRGTRGPDVIVALELGVRVNGRGGDDTICIDAGDNIVNAGAGNDYVFSGPGNDTVDGGTGDDAIWGGAGDDTLLGRSGSGNDIVIDEEGNNFISVGAGDDWVVAGPGKRPDRRGQGLRHVRRRRRLRLCGPLLSARRPARRIPAGPASSRPPNLGIRPELTRGVP